MSRGQIELWAPERIDSPMTSCPCSASSSSVMPALSVNGTRIFNALSLVDEIDPKQRAVLDSHVKTCSSCAKDLEELESVRAAIRGEMPYYEAPADFRNRVRFALRGAEYVDRDARPTDWRVWGAVAAGIAFCALATAPFPKPDATPASAAKMPAAMAATATPATRRERRSSQYAPTE